MRAGIPRRPGSPSPMSTPLSPPPRPAIVKSSSRALPRWSSSTARDACRQGVVVPALCIAAGTFAIGEADKAIAILEEALPDLPRIGGSHAQREVFEDTLIAAYLAGGRTAAPMPLLAAPRTAALVLRRSRSCTVPALRWQDRLFHRRQRW